MVGPERPLDRVLREEFQRRKGISRNDSGLVTRIAHARFRWQGWLDTAQPGHRQIHESLALDDRFRENPALFSDSEMVEKTVPAWVRDAMDFTPAFARALQTRPDLWLRARSGQAPALTTRLPNAIADEGKWKDAVRYIGTEDLYRTPLFYEGAFEIQDLNSQAIGWLCGPKPGETWWDCCAGEGGKTLHFSDLMQNKGLIWSSDTAAWRLEVLRRRAGRAKVFNYRAVEWVDTEKPPTKTKFDGALVDAPCVGVGTWHKNPDARWTTAPETASRLAELQLKLLGLAAEQLKPGGKLVYSVCTLLRRETVEVARQFAASRADLVAEEEPNPWTGAKSAEHWFWPQETGGNGMFAAVWRKAK
jgi:16S rRNA (cytosine967-C5)-methyltransferase